MTNTPTEHKACVWCGIVAHIDRELRGACSAECYRHLQGERLDKESES